MARMLSPHVRRYDEFATWLSRDFPKVKASPIWGIFLKHSLLTDNEAQRAISVSDDPILFVEELNGPLGKFVPSRPNKISIAKELVAKHDGDNPNEVTKEELEATVLHELVHWSWAKQNRPEKRNGRLIEKGDEFEREAYDTDSPRVVETDRQITVTEHELGMLSRSYESNGNPGAIGEDRVGGKSYGLYQLAANMNRIQGFINFLANAANGNGYRHFGTELINAGGDRAARSGATIFADTWVELARDPMFAAAQHAYIKASHYMPFVDNVLQATMYDIARRSIAIKDVAWSVAVQHGPGSSIFRKALASISRVNWSHDATVINAVYDERSRVDHYFRSSTERTRTAVLARFESERRRALAMT